MKKKLLFLSIFLIVINNKVYAGEIFTVSCEGEAVENIYEYSSIVSNKKEIFYEDLEVEATDNYSKDKKYAITSVRIINSSHWQARDEYYVIFDIPEAKANLNVSKDNSIITLDSAPYDHKNGLKLEYATARLSLKSGIYSGKTKTSAEGPMSGEMEWRTKCTGLTKLIKFLNPVKKSSYLDYWWAVILIIAITFFIFTQSGKRLKQIRRK